MSNEIKQKILEVSKLLYQKGMAGAYEGNVSVKDEGRIYITPSGKCKGYLTEDMIAVTDLDGNQLEGRFKPSSEIKLHLAIYRLRSDVKAVIHDHSPFATAYAMANKPIETKACPEMIIDYDKIPLVKYGTPSTDEIHEGIGQYVYDTDALLLANHGLVAYGSDVFEAFFRIESVENMAKMLAITKLLGGEKALPDDKLEALYDIRKKKHGKGKLK